MLSVVFNQTGRVSEALPVCQKVVELSPKDAEAHNNLGNTLKAAGKLDEAEASYKKTIALKIKNYISKGGFMFAMCSATDSFDIALSYYNTDFVHEFYDNTPIDKNYNLNVNYENGIAFENYELYTDPTIYEYSTIDYPSSHQPLTRSAESDYFTPVSYTHLTLPTKRIV